MIAPCGVAAASLAQGAAAEGGLDPAAPESVGAALALAAVLLAVGLVQIPLGRRLDRGLLRSTPPAGRSVFRMTDFALIVGVFVLSQVLVAVLYSLFVSGDPEISETFFEDLGALSALGLTAAGQAIPAAVVVLLALLRPGGAAVLGVARPTRGWRAPYAIGRYVLALPTLFGLIVLTSAIYLATGAEPPQQEASLLVQDGLQRTPFRIALFVAIVIPLLEEIIFRGFVLELLVSRLGRFGGIVLSSGLFASLHGAAAFLPIFGLAVVLSAVKLRTRSLGAVWLVHGLHNGAMTMLLHLGVTVE